MTKRVTKLTDIVLSEVSLVPAGANKDAEVVLFKGAGATSGDDPMKMKAKKKSKSGDVRDTGEMPSNAGNKLNMIKKFADEALGTAFADVEDVIAKALDAYPDNDFVVDAVGALRDTSAAILAGDGGDAAEKLTKAARSFEDLLKASEDEIAAAGGDDAGDSGNEGGSDVTNPKTPAQSGDVQKMIDDAVSKAVGDRDERIQKLENDQRDRDAAEFAKAHAFPGVKPADLIAIHKTGNQEAIALISKTLKTASNVVEQSQLFQTLGASAVAGDRDPAQAAETPLAKVAKANADRINKGR